MIAVTGVTGKLGRVVLDDLLARGADVVGVARTPEKLSGVDVDVRQGDYEDPASLEKAFAGADTVLIVSSPDVTPGVRPRQHGNAISAAKAAGVGRIVYTSAISADTGPGFLADHATTEGLLRESGVPFTVLRNSFYTDIFVNPAVIEAATSTGRIAAATGGKPLNTATIADFGAAAAQALVGDGHANRVYELRGPLWTYDELAAAITEATGTTVVHEEIPLTNEDFIGALVSSGFFAEPGDDLATLLGRPATGIREVIDTARGSAS
ncbi:NAD(P)H-binding protein [Pseudonocardia sp. WMMC193]|uniref:NAD(P)H-binding protein n=1 Tax=Pseudonocardia sp. WMMC193 TaxID=2911965 RepID=UPI001F17D500|nr:NAD(P)H-binding protein [Pseudonocardia sp. WMMC193]MCF7552460.1 NAD(P)H-binding protein [Pseudonocardia sp. WMMC193]